MKPNSPNGIPPHVTQWSFYAVFLLVIGLLTCMTRPAGTSYYTILADMLPGAMATVAVFSAWNRGYTDTYGYFKCVLDFALGTILACFICMFFPPQEVITGGEEALNEYSVELAKPLSQGISMTLWMLLFMAVDRFSRKPQDKNNKQDDTPSLPEGRREDRDKNDKNGDTHG